MKTIIVISTRGFAAFRHDLVVDPGQVRFVGLFSEHDEKNVTAALREFIDEVHILPCGKAGATVAESSYVDPERARELIAGVLDDPGAGEVTLHSFDERNLLLAADLRAEFGLPGLRREDVLPFRDKCLMKERLVAKGIRVPRFGRYDTAAAADRAAYFRAIADEVGLPFILKPVDGNSADGVYEIGSFDDYAAVPADLGRPYEYEEFVDGTIYSVNIISQHRSSLTAGVTEYLVNSSAVREGRVNADINLIDTDPRVPRMIAFAEDVLDALGRPDGASHLELFLTADDELVFLEVAARFKGLAGVAAMQRNYGVALVNLAFEVEAGLASRPYDEEQVYCFDAVIPKQRGVIERLLDPDIDSEFGITWKVHEGQVLGQGESLGDNGGVFLVWNKDYDVLYRDFERLAGYQPITYRQEAR
ncbi:ATP-grasp domain-containing protein [Actinomadura sp. DC4]|uniref:ATP-grasp domain-containing protein n=1 Tax=Actinomadura sp. DC4 TaxID=3055069 RepID=UPI0025B12255|nr:ATP-grasp domain-containing protein [Actinomadura sp. DC4]MDN3354831.1 ATP-grasp domain-containing protein [Actinomadura sp. DC4]